MTQEEKDILIKDLCGRLPYGVIVKTPNDDDVYTLLSLNPNKGIAVIGELFDDVFATSKVKVEEVKPYLRPLSGITEEEKKELRLLKDSFDFNCYTAGHYNFQVNLAVSDWLLKNHFDYRGLIPMGLAIEVTEENNPYHEN